MFLRFILFLLLTALTLQAGYKLRYDINNPPEGIFDEEWMEVFLLGQKSGYAHITFRRTGDQIHTQTKTYLIISRNAINLETEVLESTIESLSGKLIHFKNETLLAGQPIHKEGHVAGNTIHITNRHLKNQTEQSYAFDPEGLMLWGMTRKTFEKGVQPGTQYSTKSYIPDFDPSKALETNIIVIGEETLTSDNENQRATRIESTVQTPIGPLTTNSWMSPEWKTLKMSLSIAGMPVEMIASTELKALKSFTPADLFQSTFIHLNKSIPWPTDKVSYILSTKSGDAPVSRIPTTDFQTVESLGKGRFRITVQRATTEFLNSLPETKVSPKKEFLESNIMIDSDHEKIQMLAHETTASDTSLLEKAQHLRHFTTDYITKKNLNVGFASASEVVSKPEGDCSEHAVLLAALGRASGIPSRVVSGIAYIPQFENEKNIMGYHMWTQFYIKGKWVDFDAALGESECQPTRIALMTSSLRDTSLSGMGLALIEYVNQINIEVESISPSPEKNYP